MTRNGPPLYPLLDQGGDLRDCTLRIKSQFIRRIRSSVALASFSSLGRAERSLSP